MSNAERYSSSYRSGMDTIQPFASLAFKTAPIIYKAHIVLGAPLGQPTVQQPLPAVSYITTPHWNGSEPDILGYYMNIFLKKTTYVKHAVSGAPVPRIQLT